MRRLSSLSMLGGVALVATLGSACAKDLDTERAPPVRGTIGEELYGVMCERVAAQALHEDMTGASYQGVCHKSAAGEWADAVDEKFLPAAKEGAVDLQGNPVSADQQQKNRAYALARIGALVRRRADLIEAFDTAFPDVEMDVKNVAAGDDPKSCDIASKQRKLGRELADMLGRFGPLYDDGTVPHSTESLARLMNAFRDSPEAQQALSRLASREGYRPAEIALGVVRPMLAYPRMHDLAAETMRLLAADSDPYAIDPPRDADGRRKPVPGAAYVQLTSMLAGAHEELRTVKADPPLAPLVATIDPVSGREVLSRPRSNLEVLRQLFYAEDPAFGVPGAAPRYIVKRDKRGYAKVALVNGTLPAPFVDKNGDGLADVDTFGRFVSSSGQAPPTPFVAVGSDAPAAPRDGFGRALSGANLLYEYIDTSHTFTAQMLADTKALVDPDPVHNHETMMNAVAGAYVIMGDRTGDGGSTKTYPADPSQVDVWKLTHAPEDPPPADLATRPVTLLYNGVKPDASPMLDLVWAFGQVLGDRTMDDTLQLVNALMKGHPNDVARLVGAALVWKAVADKHPEARNLGAPKSTFWDEMADIAQQIAKEPGLLEDLLRALGDDQSLPLKNVFSNYMKYDDHISYDRQNLNGPPYNLTTKSTAEMRTPVDRSKPDTGFNKSAFQRFAQAIYDTTGVTACNKEDAVVHAKGVPLAGSIDICAGGPCALGFRKFHECEVFKIENLGKFYTDAIVGKANLYFRPSILRNGVAGIGAATVDTIEQSSGLEGFWDPPDAKIFRPQPRWLNRLVFFDLANDSVTSGLNHTTNQFIRDLQGLHMGSAVCPERVINDPDPGAADASPDGLVHGLRACKDGDWVDQRDLDATMVWENFGFYNAMTPTVNAFVNHKREDLFLGLMSTVHKHWQDDKGTANECNPTNPKDPHWCARDGLVSYEPLLSEAFVGDLLTGLHDVEKTLETTTIQRCTALDANKKCTTTTTVNGITVLAEATRALLDPDRAKAAGLLDRAGHNYGVRNDGTATSQVTPFYLMTEALNEIDASFAAFAAAHPDDNTRQAKWQLARSQLVDQFLGVNGTGKSATFANPALVKITPTLVGMLRSQLLANCPDSFTPPFKPCAWARQDLTRKMTDVVKGPLFAGTMDMMDAIRKDDAARRELQAVMRYLMEASSDNDALATMLATMSDVMQAMDDDDNMVPMFHVFAEAAAGSLRDPSGKIVQTSMVDAQSQLLARISLKAYDANQREICGKEVDPNQVLTVMLQNLVTPLKTNDGKLRKTPLEVIMDVIADVNRVAPERTDRLDTADYANVANEVSDFLLNKESGLEQFYAIVRNGVSE